MSGGLVVGLLFGGRSVEHEVSLVSARGVASALVETEHECLPLAVTGQGRWLSPELSRRILDGDAARVEPDAGDDDGVSLLFAPAAGLVRLAPDGSARPLAVDVIFPLLHGWGGEDGRLQGALDLAGLPYVGAGVLGSAVGMDKAVSKHLFEANELAVAPWLLVTGAELERDAAAVGRRVADELGFPVFVKPANGGSSVGITRVDAAAELSAALEEAAAHDRRIVVEQALDAREIECAVLGDDEPLASGLGEILPSRKFYDYAAKYLDEGSELIIPAVLDHATTERVRAAALAAYRALDLAGLARVDFLIRRSDGAVFVNEANTLPGFTPISMFPKLWQAAGLSYARVVGRLVELAVERQRRHRGMRTRLR
jgi:D-alanine-D-alanine ligase